MAAYASHSFVIDFQRFFDVGPKRLSSNAKWPGPRVRGNGTPDIPIFMGKNPCFFRRCGRSFLGKISMGFLGEFSIFIATFSPQLSIQGCAPPSDVCWFINHSWRIAISTINQVVKLEL